MKDDPSSLQPPNTTGPSTLSDQRYLLPTDRASLLLETVATEPIEKPVQVSPFLIRHTNPFRIYWDIFVIVLCVYNSISIPLSVGFSTVVPRQVKMLQEFDYCVDLLFLVDLVLNFCTTYTDTHGEEVRSLSAIRKHYFSSGNLIIDTLSVLPFDDCVEWADAGIDSSSLKVVKCLKLVRLMRLRRILALLKLKKDIKLVLKISVVLYFLFLFIHTSAALFSLLNGSPEDYTPPNEIGRDPDYYNPDMTAYRYALSFYYVILMLLGADTVMFNTAQSSFATTVLLIGSMITAVLFGQITVLILNLNGESAAMQEATEAMNDVMLSLKLPKGLVNHVQEFLSRTHNYRKRQSDLRQFFQMVPDDLKQQVMNSVFMGAINNSGLFDPNTHDKVLKDLKMTHTKPEETIVRRGDRSEDVFILSTGEAMVFTVMEQGEEILGRTLYPGSYFGELGVLLGCRRSATVTSVNYCVLAALSNTVFLRVSTPTMRWRLKEHAFQTYREGWREFVCSALRKVPCLAAASDLEVALLAFQVRPSRLAAGSYVVQTGFPAPAAIIVVSGVLSLELDLGFKGKFPSFSLPRGSICFPTAFLTKEKQPHGVVVTKEAVILQLDVEVVTELKKRVPAVRSVIECASLVTADCDFIVPAQSPVDRVRMVAIRTGIKQRRQKPVRRPSIFDFSRISEELLAQNRKSEEMIEVSESDLGSACLKVFQMSMSISKGVEALQQTAKSHESVLKSLLS